MRKVLFAAGEVYHLYNRGADKREVFCDDIDRLRFLRDLEEMNSGVHVQNLGHYFLRNPATLNSIVNLPVTNSRARGERFVDILAFVLMPNHFHLLLAPLSSSGVQAFMQKLGTAYTMYFNKRWTRSGILFEGPYKSVHIKREDHYEWIAHYIHANPLKLTPVVKLPEAQLEVLKEYRWSSFADYARLPGRPGITDTDHLQDFFARDGGLFESTLKWLQNRRGLRIEASPR